MTPTINVQLNFFGPYIQKEQIPETLKSSGESGGILGNNAALLSSFLGLPVASFSQDILERYCDVTPEDLHLPIVPHSKVIFERLLVPLKSAKRNYCLGEYSATIALCGVVGEMLAMLLWKINEININGRTLAEKDEEALFGYSFEKLGQERRIKILKTYGLITESQFNALNDIKNGRKPYLHLWSADLANEKKDALSLFKKSLGLFKEITGIGLAGSGSVRINPLLLKLFRQEGLTE